MILVSFPSGGCVHEIVDNRANYQGCKYIYFLQYHILIGRYFINGEEVVRLSEQPF